MFSIFLIFIHDNLISPYENSNICNIVFIHSELKQIYYKIYFTNVQNTIRTADVVIDRQDLTDKKDVETLICYCKYWFPLRKKKKTKKKKHKILP